MATNEKFRDADHLSLPVPSGKVSGDHVRVGGLNGVCQTDRDAGGNPAGYASVWLKGAHVFTVAFAIVAIGDPVYITPAGDLSGTATSNFLFGHALSIKGAPSGPLTVRIAN